MVPSLIHSSTDAWTTSMMKYETALLSTSSSSVTNLLPTLSFETASSGSLSIPSRQLLTLPHFIQHLHSLSTPWKLDSLLTLPTLSLRSLLSISPLSPRSAKSKLLNQLDVSHLSPYPSANVDSSGVLEQDLEQTLSTRSLSLPTLLVSLETRTASLLRLLRLNLPTPSNSLKFPNSQNMVQSSRAARNPSNSPNEKRNTSYLASSTSSPNTSSSSSTSATLSTWSISSRCRLS